MVDFNSTEVLAGAYIIVIILAIIFGSIGWWIKFHDD